MQSCSDSLHEVYDCGLDDFFNPSPAPGSYLATHWNLYDSVFLCAAGTCGDGSTASSPPPVSTTPPPTTVVAPPSATTPPATSFKPGTLAGAVRLVRAAARIVIRLATPRPALAIGRATCPNVCRGAVSLYVLRGHGVHHSLRLGRVTFSLREGHAADLRVPIPASVVALLRRHRRLNASLTLTANRSALTRRFTLRAA